MDLNERNNISLDTESLGSPVPLKMGHTQAGNNSGNGNTNNNTDDPIKKLVQTITAILKVRRCSCKYRRPVLSSHSLIVSSGLFSSTAHYFFRKSKCTAMALKELSLLFGISI